MERGQDLAVVRKKWRWDDRPKGWWYLLPMSGYMTWLAVRDDGILRVIDVVLAVSGVVLVLRSLRVPRDGN